MTVYFPVEDVQYKYALATLPFLAICFSTYTFCSRFALKQDAIAEFDFPVYQPFEWNVWFIIFGITAIYSIYKLCGYFM